MFAIQLRFPAGRYHATPWGRHVNEGVPEWPPSPWRLLRALVAVWKRTAPNLPSDTVRVILEPLAAPPHFTLPPAGVAHTRHYMPWEKKEPADRTLVFDTFVVLGAATPVVVSWPQVNLSPSHARILDDLLAHLGFLGRAESWCLASRLPPEQASTAVMAANCLPLQGELTTTHEPVRVLCADPLTAFGNELRPRGSGRRQEAHPPPLCDPAWNLCVETLDLHASRRADLPGARWVTYARLSTCLTEVAVSPCPVAVRTPAEEVDPPMTVPARPLRPLPTVARFVLDAPVLPSTAETLPLADQVRRVLLGIGRRLREEAPASAGIVASEVFLGKDATGRPLQGHGHAYFLPTDEDGDGRLDHVTVLADRGFCEPEVRALDRLRRLPWGDGEPLRLVLAGLGTPEDLRSPLLDTATCWVSATPFVATRYPKARGRQRDDPALREPAHRLAFLAIVLREELERLRQRRPNLPPVAAVEALPDQRLGGGRLWPTAFQRGRSKAGDEGRRRPSGGLRIVFAAPAAGPLVLGQGGHYGMGLFLPEGSRAVSASEPPCR